MTARLLGALRELREVSVSQRVVRGLGLACVVLLVLVAPAGTAPGWAASALCLLTALLAAGRPEPYAGPTSLGALGLRLALVSVDLEGPRPVLVAALALGHLACLALSTTVPPSGRVSRALGMRYLLRWARATALALAVWGFVLLAAHRMPPATVAVSALALAGVGVAAALALAVGRDDG